MNSVLKSLRSNLALQSLAFVVAGVALLIVPNVTMLTLVYIIAFLLTIIGAWYLISFFRVNKEGSSLDGVSKAPLVYGVILLIVPILMFIFPYVFVSFISMLAGIVLFLSGLVNIKRSLSIRNPDDKAWVFSLVLSILIAVAGVMLVYDPFQSATLFVRILGICLVVNGLADLLLIYWSR